MITPGYTVWLLNPSRDEITSRTVDTYAQAQLAASELRAWALSQGYPSRVTTELSPNTEYVREYRAAGRSFELHKDTEGTHYILTPTTKKVVAYGKTNAEIRGRMTRALDIATENAQRRLGLINPCV